MTDGSPFAELEARLRAVREDVFRGLPGRADEVAAAAEALAGGEPDAREHLVRLAHRLRGLVGTVGLPELGEQAGELEDRALDGSGDDELVAAGRALAEAVRTARVPGPPSQVPRPRPSQAAPDDPVRVLAIDDDAATRRLLTLTLRLQTGYETVAVEDPDEVLAQVGDFDLVLLDVRMPRVDGRELYAKIRERHDTPVVMLSAESREALGWDPPADPRLRWLRKPFRPGALPSRLRAFLREVAGS